MAVRFVISDLDGVLLDFHPERRLRYLADLTGLPGERIHTAIWGSDFEPAAEAGAYPTGEAYLAEFNARLGAAVSRADWIEARRRAMRPRREVLEFFRALAARADLALLTNNGALLRESLPELVPEICALFGERLFASFELGARKPDPRVYLRLLQRHGVEPAEAIFVDDSPANVEGARSAGLHGILYEGVPRLEAEIRGLLIPSP